MAQQAKRKRRTKAQIEADKAKVGHKGFKEGLDAAMEIAKEAETRLMGETIGIEQPIKDHKPKSPELTYSIKDKNPSIQFLRKNGKPVMIPLDVCLNAQKMKERTYALGYAEQFADENWKEKVKGIMFNGKKAEDLLKERYNA